MKAWEGLGYYRRARLLRETAKSVIAKHGGIFPDDEAGLSDLPGVGPYTCAALLAFAFDKPSALLDGNVSRVLSRLTDDSLPIDSTATIKRHRTLALELCDPQNPSRHHHAMMELGQTHCRPGVPDCFSCPVSAFCETTRPEELPVKKPKAKLSEIREHAFWCIDEKGRVLLHKESGSRRTGLWKLPLRTAEEAKLLPVVFSSTYQITRYKVTLTVHLAGSSGLRSGDEWIDRSRLEAIPMAAPFRKAVDNLLNEL